MKLVLILAVLLSAPLARAKDIPPNDVGVWHAFPTGIGWVDSAKLDAGATEIARLKSRLAGKASDQAQQIRADATPAIAAHLRDACAKVKADKHLSLVVSDPLAAEPKAEVTTDVLRLWNAADEASVAQENARLTAKVAQLEAAALTKPEPPKVPPPPPIAPRMFADKPKK